MTDIYSGKLVVFAIQRTYFTINPKDLSLERASDNVAKYLRFLVNPFVPLTITIKVYPYPWLIFLSCINIKFYLFAYGLFGSKLYIIIFRIFGFWLSTFLVSYSFLILDRLRRPTLFLHLCKNSSIYYIAFLRSQILVAEHHSSSFAVSWSRQMLYKRGESSLRELVVRHIELSKGWVGTHIGCGKSIAGGYYTRHLSINGIYLLLRSEGNSLGKSVTGGYYSHRLAIDGINVWFAGKSHRLSGVGNLHIFLV